MAFTPPPVESYIEEQQQPQARPQFVPPPPESFQPDPEDFSRVPIPDVGALRVPGTVPLEQRVNQTPTRAEMQDGSLRELPPEGVVSKARRVLAPLIGAPNGEIMSGPAASDVDRRGFVRAILSPEKKTFPRLTAEDVATGNVKALLPGNLNAAGENPESFYNSTPGYEAPTWAKIAAGAQRAVAATGDVVANPMLTAGFAMTAGVPLLSRAASATFGVQMLKDLPDVAHSFNEAVKGGDVQGATEALVGGGLGAYFGIKAMQHAGGPGIAKESPMVRRLLSKQITETFTPEQLKESFIRVTRGVATPQEVEMFRFINEAFESPREAIKSGVKVTQSEPVIESKFWSDYLGLEKGPKKISPLNKGEQNANRQSRSVPEVSRNEAESVQANAAGTPGNVRQITGAGGGQAIEAPRPFTPPPPVVTPEQPVAARASSEKEELADLLAKDLTEDGLTKEEEQRMFALSRAESRSKRSSKTNKESAMLKEAGVLIPDVFFNPADGVENHITGWTRDKNGYIQIRVESHTESSVSPRLITVKPGDTLSHGMADDIPGTTRYKEQNPDPAPVIKLRPDPPIPASQFPVLPPGNSPIVIERTDGTRYAAAANDTAEWPKEYLPPGITSGKTIHRVTLDDNGVPAWSTGMLDPGEKIVEPTKTVAVNPPIPKFYADDFEKSNEKRQPTNTIIDPAGGYPVTEIDVDPTTLELSRDVPQFKEGAGAGGEVQGQELKGEYTRVGTGRTVVWERLDGKREIVTGRHKWQLALRNKLKDFPVQIVRESDGFTREQALVLDAESNIRDNQGSLRDYAHYFKQTAKGERSYSKEDAIARGLLRDAKGRNGWDIGRNASDDLYSIWRAEKVSDGQAVAIAKAAPGNADLQALGIRKALEGLNPEELVGFLKSSIIETGGDPSQIDLFGNSDAALNRSVEIGKKAAARQREIYDEIRAVQGAAKNPTVAARHGVDVKDPQGVLKRIAELKAELEKWEHWEKHAELIAQLTAGEPKEVSGDGKENEKGKKQEVLKPKTGSPEKSGGQSVKPPLPKGQTEISLAQALAIHGGRKKLLPAKGETKPQPSDTSGEYFVGQTKDGRFFTEHKPKEPNETITDTSGRFESEGGIAKAAANHLRESIGTDKRSIAGAEASSRQAGILAEWATSNGLMVDVEALAKLPKLSDDTHEHHVALDEKNNLVIKQTWPGSFGNGPVKSDTGIWREHLTPLQYLERVELQNKVFGDTTKVIGFAYYPDRFMRRPGGLSIVTSQHFVQIGDDKNPTPSQKEIDKFMESRGFESIPGEVPLWRRASDGVLVMDARADNFIKTQSGAIIPIDLQIGREPKPAVRNLTKAEQKRFGELTDKARAARDNNGEPLTGEELREYQALEKIAGAQDLLVESTSANDAAIEGEVKRLRAKAAELDRQVVLTHNRANASNVRDVKNKLRKAAYDLEKESVAARNKADELEATLKRKVGGNDLTLQADQPTVDKTKVETVKEDDLFGAPSAKPIISDGHADALRKRIQDRIKKNQGDSGKQGSLPAKPVKVKKTDEQIADEQRQFSDSVQLGAYYITKGLYKFPEWSTQMRSDFGDSIEPQLKSIYETAKITIESPSGEGAKGRAPGLQPGLKPPTERIVTARSEFTKRADESIIPPEIAKHLDDHQRQGAASALVSMNSRGAFLLADGTGAGKTRQAIAVADYYAKLGKKVVIVTKAETIKPDWKKNTFGGSYAFDSNAMGVKVSIARDGVVSPGHIGITTYQNLASVENASDSNTVLIFDESHALKNDSQQARHGMRAVAKAEKVMFMSATPADKPEHIYYLAPIGVMEGKTVQQALRDLGMTLVTVKKWIKENGRMVQREITYWTEDQTVTDSERHRRFSALFDRMTSNGSVLKREISMDGVHVQVLKLSLPPEAHEAMGEILNFFDAASIEDLKGLRKAQVLGHQRRQQEPFKVASTVMLAKRELDAGRQVVIFVSRVNESEVGKWVTTDGPMGKDRFRQVLMSSEGTVKTLVEALREAGIHDIAEIHGNADQASLEAMADYQSGRKRVVVATIESGGTGINLDDTVGNRPRSMIVVTAPFDAVGNVQAAGRIWRLKTLSGSSVYYLFGDTEVDDWNADIIGTKMSMLGAVVEGQVRRLNMSDPDLVGTDDFHSSVAAAPEKKEVAASGSVPVLDWKPFKTKAGKDKFIAPATKEFWDWYNANGKGDNQLGLRPSKWQGEWQVWADSIPSTAQASLRVKRADKEAMLVGILGDAQMKSVRSRLNAGTGLDAAIKREVGNLNPSGMTPDEFYSLYAAHVTNLRDGSAPLTEDQINKGMTGGWVVNTRPTTSWDFSRGNYKPGHQVVIVPEYWIEEKGGRPARIANGYKPRQSEVAILGEDDFTPDGLVDFLKVFKVGSDINQASLPSQITPVGQPQAPVQAKTLPELRALVNSPATGLSKEAVTLINAFLDSPLADTLEGLTVKIQDVVETGWDGSYFQGVVELARNADPKAGVHEFLHRAWEVLPADIKAEFERMRVESLKDLAKEAGEDATRVQQIEDLIANPTTGTADFLARGLPRDLYEFSRAEELFTHSGSDQFRAKVGSIKEGFWARVKDFIKDFIAALKKAFRFKQTQEDWLRNILNGNFKITPESGTAYEARQASLGKPDPIVEAERARSDVGLNLTDLEMPKEIARLAEEQAREGVPTETFNVVNFVAGRQRLDDTFRQAGQRFTQQVFAEIGIPVRSGPSDLFLMADPSNPDPVAWTKMIERLKKELAEQRVEGRADATGGLVNYLDSLILMWQTQRQAFELMPPEIGRQLFQFAQGERSFRGLLLGAMAHLDNSVSFVGQNVDTLLQRVWSDQFNGAVVTKVLDRVLTEFKDFFTDEELRQVTADAPDLTKLVDEIIQRTKDANPSDKVYQRASAWLKPKKPKGIRALQADARVKEAVEWILDAATKAGVVPTKPVSKKMTPQEQLLHLLTPGVAPQIQASIEKAFVEMEWDAALSASKPDDRPAMIEARDAGADPDPELVAKGLALPKFAKWVATRDFVENNLLGYNPVTLKLVQDLVTSEFAGSKFGKPVAKPADTRIDLRKLAKSPDDEVRRVLDAYLADIEANMQMKGAPPELRQRIKRMIYAQVRDQIASRREEFINSFISPKKSLPLSASVKLRQLINAGISKDFRFQSDKVRQLIKKIAGEYTKDVPFESLATSTRAEKQQWLERKADEIGIAEKFSQYDEDTRAQLEATVWTYLAERLQAAEEGITRQFLRGNDVKYEKEQLTPDQRQASLDAAKSKIEGLVRAGAFDTSMVEAIGGKSSLAKLTPGLGELVKQALATPFYRQSELGEQFADKLVSEFSIDEAQRDKAKAAFNRAFANKFKTARAKAAEKAYESLTPQEKKAMPPRSPIWRKIERVVNADADFSTGETLKQIARDNGWEVPSDEQIALVKDMSEQIQRLRELTPEEAAAITDPALRPQAEAVKAAATQERRVALKRQIETYWARWTQPITLKSQMGRANAVAASYEFSAANLLFRLGFMSRQGIDVFTQIIMHIPSRSIGNAIVQHGGFWKNTGNVEFWRDASSLLKQAIGQQIEAVRPALREFREALRGTAEAKNVDRLMSGIALFERLDQKAGELDAAGKHGQAFAMRFFGMVKFSYRFASALDNLQGVPQEWQEMRTQAFRTFRNNGMTTAEAKVATDTIIGDLKAEHLRARSLARQYLDATGRGPTKAELDAAAWHIVKALAYQRMRDAGMPADDFEERNRMMRSTNAWNEGIASVNSVGGVAANLAKRVGELGKSAAKASPVLMPIAAIASSFGRFGNAMGTAIDRSLTYSPLGLFPSAFGVNEQHIDPETGTAGRGSPWYRTREDRAQRAVESSIGTAFGALVTALVLGAFLIVRNSWPKDKEKRDLWDRMGWKPGTVALQLGNGEEIVMSMTVGPMAMVRPYLAGAGALRDALDAKAEKQAKLNEEAEKLGLPPGQVKPLDLADMFSIAGNTMWASVMGGRTASGLVGSLTDYGTFNPSKTTAATVSPLIPGLPAVQEASRMAGVSLDANLATFADFLVPMPTSGARRVNLLGDPSGTPSDMQRIVQILTGGTYPGITSSEAAKSQAGYSALFQTGYRPPSINPNKAYAFDGAYRPMKDEELSKYTQLRGQYLKEELSNLGDNPDERSARAAYQTANSRALSEMGVQVQTRRAAQSESQPASSRGVPTPSSNASVAAPRFARVSAGRGRIAPIRKLRSPLRSSQRIRPLRPLKLKRQKYAAVRRVRVPRFA